ncbi:ATP-binding cassette domain-containing protein [Sinorhizobium mexicanum]|uniref:Sugar ABC transporter ATP-binding protein n=1 Tax=Sinorhizobium mexicanum TaxID=375549 RepID=A0A859R1H7_9HYPH|nr:ATP-binding cassette domain-containing protein [Sinorhizobium mexicanum]MBP1884147.1 ribose transport system ATP-binding protein [Sinorhizobium mexicanum]QLL64861.1 sugar ABC transporter ATP-binding protein [Sinorhizobium mexicanum]
MSSKNVVLRYDNLVLAPGRRPLSGVIRAGEITGVAGLEGHGQEQFLLALAGLSRSRDGSIAVAGSGKGGVGYKDHYEAAHYGVVYLPRDRRSTGIFPVLSVLDNFAVPAMPRFSFAGILDRKRLKQELASYTAFLSIRYPSADAPISALSGGNQQKVLLARLLALKPRVMLLNDPTRGVDLNTRLKFYEAFRTLAAENGIALVILSSEIEEILQLCHTVAIFRDFECSTVLDRASMSMDRVMAAMFGQEGGHE